MHTAVLGDVLVPRGGQVVDAINILPVEMRGKALVEVVVAVLGLERLVVHSQGELQWIEYIVLERKPKVGSMARA